MIALSFYGIAVFYSTIVSFIGYISLGNLFAYGIIFQDLSMKQSMEM